MKVVVIGSVALDTLETLYGRREEVLGGSAPFACVAASYLAPTGMVGVVGADFPQSARDLFARLGVDTSGLATLPGRTFRWSGRYHADMIGRDTTGLEFGVFEGWEPQVPESYRDAEYVIMGNISPHLQLAFLEQFRAPRFVLADTMKIYIEHHRDELNKVIGKCQALVVNDEEARLLTGEASLIRAAGHLMEAGPRFVIVKRGEHGASLHGPQGTFYVPAVPVPMVKDPTGAGDSFLGGLAGYVARCGKLNEEVLRQALVVASAVASFTVEDFSIERLAGMERAELLARCGQIRAMTTFTAVEI